MPKSFIGNNDHWKCINDQRIIKPISVGKIETSSGIAIIQTNLMHENDSYDSPELTPVYIQEYIKKSLHQFLPYFRNYRLSERSRCSFLAEEDTLAFLQ